MVNISNDADDLRPDESSGYTDSEAQRRDEIFPNPGVIKAQDGHVQEFQTAVE